MNILVTGANGQLGHEMLRVSQPNKHNYIFTDAEELDITKEDEIQDFIKNKGIDIIVNCAAYTNVDQAEADFKKANLINNIAVGYLAKAAKDNNITLIHISTDYVFNGENNIPYLEQDMTGPIGVYGQTKLDGENAIVKSGCNYIIIRTAWLYSVWGNNFLKTMLKLTKEKESLNVVFDQVGSPTYAGDLAEAIEWIIDRKMIDQKGIYHFSNEGVCSWYDFTEMINRLAGHSCKINPIHSNEFPSKVKRPHYSVLDKVNFRETFGYKVPYWVDSLEKCIRQIKNA